MLKLLHNCHKAVYKKERYFDSVTDALSMFVERRCNAVQIRLMAVIYLKSEIKTSRKTNYDTEPVSGQKNIY